MLFNGGVAITSEQYEPAPVIVCYPHPNYGRKWYKSACRFPAKTGAPISDDTKKSHLLRSYPM